MRLIDADDLRKEVEYIPWCEYWDVQKIIDKQPTIDAEPVRHAHWKVDFETPYCSHCGVCPEDFFHTDGYDVVVMNRNDDKPKYCLNCGAKMDEEE